MIVCQDTVDYIISFLCYGNKEASIHVIYGEPCAEIKNKTLYIKPSNFFDESVYKSKRTIPSLPLKTIDGTPFLFGEDIVEKHDNYIYVHADLVASTYFFISRYEEIIDRHIRDKHGRFIGKESVAYKAGFLEKPIVDVYSNKVKTWLYELGIKTEYDSIGFSAVNLTHDVDRPWESHTFKSAIRRICGLAIKQHTIRLFPLLNYFGDVQYDPNYIFDYFIELDNRVKAEMDFDARDIYFIKTNGGKATYDGSLYWGTRPYYKLLSKLKRHSIIGIHFSYEAGMNPSICTEEVGRLKSDGVSVSFSRNHYLDSREPSDFHQIIKAGITDDYTMGFADTVGFRLGTCRPVRWIDPLTCRLTELTLHHLSVMESTLFGPEYMALSSEEAIKKTKQIIDIVWNYGGELNLLWHNNPIHSQTIKIYPIIIEYIIEKKKERK